MTSFPHRTCLTDPLLIWLSFVFDLLIMLAYYAIPVCLMAIYASRPRSTRWTYSIRSSILVLFAAFIFFCGTTHLFEAITLFYPWYWAEVVVKAITAAASLLTIGVLVHRHQALVSFPSKVEADYQKLNEMEHRLALLIQNT